MFKVGDKILFVNAGPYYVDFGVIVGKSEIKDGRFYITSNNIKIVEVTMILGYV